MLLLQQVLHASSDSWMRCRPTESTEAFDDASRHDAVYVRGGRQALASRKARARVVATRPPRATLRHRANQAVRPPCPRLVTGMAAVENWRLPRSRTWPARRPVAL